MAKRAKSEARPLAEQRRALPNEPGTYLFNDRDGKVIYVGKARSIRKRVASHFSKHASSRSELVDQIDSIDFVVTANEAEALLAEQQLIKRHRPRFNIRLRDDKSYPYIGVSLDEEFPRVYFTRERHRANRAYFGPYSNAKRVRETLDLLGKLFQYRTCEGPQPGRRSGVPCLDYYIKRCGAPCVGYIDAAEYREGIEAIMRFLSGRYREIYRDLEAEMRAAAEAQEFERAAAFRDRLSAVRSLMERQRIRADGMGTADVIAVARDGEDASAQVFQLRDGMLVERHGFYLSNRERRDEGEVAEEFIAQYYSAASFVPRLIIVGPELEERAGLLSEALTLRRGAPVEVRVAKRGEKRGLRELAERNAKLALGQERLRRERRRAERADALAELAEALGLEEIPVRIEGFDISNLGADHTVASMVVFEAGAPKKEHYRRFKIREDRENGSPAGPDDFRAMEQVLRRRSARFSDQADLSPHDGSRDESFASQPGVILIDGGKGQLAAGVRALGELAERGTSVISLAKRQEEVFVPGRTRPVAIRPDSDASRLLQRVRDEAHRFALDFHRERRGKAMTASAIDGLRGVGPVRRRALLDHFGSADRIIAASREELEAVPGIPGKLAREIHSQLHRI